jgi:ADP-ribose pyrophosphatase YjhB (NUDIX family)
MDPSPRRNDLPHERHKSIAIPVSCSSNGAPAKFLLVHDRRYKEWTFVTGGCRRREIFNPLRCAVRELEEETRGIINLKKGTYSYFSFSFKDTEGVNNVYHVYVFDVQMSDIEQSQIVTKFNEEKAKMDGRQVPFRKNYDENDSCEFDTLEGITGRRDLWDMIRTHVLRNPQFQKFLAKPEKQPFFIRP